jgi:hypothetical protein
VVKALDLSALGFIPKTGEREVMLSALRLVFAGGIYRPGAAGNIAVEAVVRAPPDGYTLLLVAAGNAIDVTLFDKLKYDFIRDIVPVAPRNRRSGYHGT